MSAATTRSLSLTALLKDLLGRLFGSSAEGIDSTVSFIDMGADSLFLLQMSQSLESQFGVKVPFRLLLDDVSTIEALAAHLDARLPADHPAVVAPARASVSTAAVQPAAPAAAGQYDAAEQTRVLE